RSLHGRDRHRDVARRQREHRRRIPRRRAPLPAGRARRLRGHQHGRRLPPAVSMTRAHRWLLGIVLALGGCASAPPEEQAVADLDVTFAGADSQFAFRLRRVIADLLVEFARDPDDEAPLFDAAQDLQDHYLGLGFPEARVDYIVERTPRLLVVFTVHEGPRVTVSEMVLKDNEAPSTDELLPLWPRTRSGVLATGDPWFVEEELKAFAVGMAGLYAQRGFLGARIQGPDIERAPGGTTAKVTFTIAEGPRYTIGSTAIGPGLPLSEAMIGLAQMVGKPYDGDELQALRQRARA